MVWCILVVTAKIKSLRKIAKPVPKLTGTDSPHLPTLPISFLSLNYSDTSTSSSSFFVSSTWKMRGPGRPLSELLQEQQEPFVLDVYLAERGHYCSERLLLLASNKSSSCTFCCHGNASKKLQFLTSHGFIKYWKNAFTSCHKTPNHHHHHRSNYSVVHCKLFKNFSFFFFLFLCDYF